MRITKKFSGSSCIGKQVFIPCEANKYSAAAQSTHLLKLQSLENLFLGRIHSKPDTQPSGSSGGDDRLPSTRSGCASTTSTDTHMKLVSSMPELSRSSTSTSTKKSSSRSSGASLGSESCKAAGARSLSYTSPEARPLRKGSRSLSVETGLEFFDMDNAAASDLLLKFSNRMYQRMSTPVAEGTKNPGIRGPRAVSSADDVEDDFIVGAPSMDSTDNMIPARMKCTSHIDNTARNEAKQPQAHTLTPSFASPQPLSQGSRPTDVTISSERDYRMATPSNEQVGAGVVMKRTMDMEVVSCSQSAPMKRGKYNSAGGAGGDVVVRTHGGAELPGDIQS